MLGESVDDIHSHHHQGIREVGEGLIVAAHADDGSIEAIEDPSQPFCMAVLWHPEESAAGDRRATLPALVDAAAQRRRARSLAAARASAEVVHGLPVGPLLVPDVLDDAAGRSSPSSVPAAIETRRPAGSRQNRLEPQRLQNPRSPWVTLAGPGNQRRRPSGSSIARSLVSAAL